TLAAVASTGAPGGTTLEPGPPGRLLVLAERRDAGWAASVDGRPIAATTVDGWAQGFVLPQRGGRLVVRYDTGLDGSTDGSRLALLVLAVLVALPLPRVRRRVAVAPARPSRPVPRGVVTPPTPVAPSPQVFDAEHPEAAPDAGPDEQAWPMTPVPRRRLFRRRPGRGADEPDAVADESPDESPGGAPDAEALEGTDPTDADPAGADPAGADPADADPTTSPDDDRQEVR
ncbi:MAG: hypothetical protein HY830_06890, partial [Actinobacteria bacterium]|nr:hypothetical protein [Actinomycetota bacterium]